MRGRHFSLAQWADFVRRLASDHDARAMSEHLAAGCNRCSRTAGALRRLVQLAKADAGPSPPGFAKRSVKALFSLQQPERRSQLPCVRLRLAADNALAPAYGARGREDSARQAHYESGEYSLDLRLDIPPGARQGILSGQLLKSTGEPVPQTAAYLISGGEVAAGCFADDLGDFQMELGHQEALELWLLVGGTEALAVSLDHGSALRPS